MARSGLFYVRFMDDIVVLAPSHWKLRRAVKAVNEVLGGLSFEQHPDKTFIGRIERGFDFLGRYFSRQGLTVAKATFERFVERAARLYEQDRKEPCGPPRSGRYVRRWVGWVRMLAGAVRGNRTERELEFSHGAATAPACLPTLNHWPSGGRSSMARCELT